MAKQSHGRVPGAFIAFHQPPPVRDIRQDKPNRFFQGAGERHKHLADDWGDTHYIEIMADNQDQARSNKARAKFPQADGYVIEQVVPALEI